MEVWWLYPFSLSQRNRMFASLLPCLAWRRHAKASLHPPQPLYRQFVRFMLCCRCWLELCKFRHDCYFLRSGCNGPSDELYFHLTVRPSMAFSRPPWAALLLYITPLAKCPSSRETKSPEVAYHKCWHLCVVRECWYNQKEQNQNHGTIMRLVAKIISWLGTE